MGALIGFVFGYVLGTRAGPNGFEELRDAWRTISSSEEVKEMLIGGISLARDLGRHGRVLLAERLQVEEKPKLRTVA